MARPKKYSVDYFPHFCKPSKTLYIIESRFGNDGYAFWFKLLEILAVTDGHKLHVNDPIQLEFLGAKTGLSSEKTTEILELLARLDAIDKELWEQNQLIWCQKLVDNVANVYENRSGILPQKPYFLEGILCQNIDNHHNNPTETELSTEKLPYNTHTILERGTILDNTKVNNILVIWNKQEIVVHKKLTDDTKRAIENSLKNNTEEEIKQAILNYAEILKGEQYYFKYAWTLKDFLKRGIEKFSDIQIAKKNYLKDNKHTNDKQLDTNDVRNKYHYVNRDK